MNAQNAHTQNDNNNQSDNYTKDYVAAYQADDATQAKQPKQPDQSTQSESEVSQKLADQNVFFLLGVDDGTPEQKEQFLDELQQVIWEDFLENDLELLITTDEMDRVNHVLDDDSLSDLEKQEEIINYIEELIPDLEEIMLEKALELKEDMAKERVNGMKEYYADNKESLALINQAEQAFRQGKWRSGAELLNQAAQ
jgi:hypothetical protein